MSELLERIMWWREQPRDYNQVYNNSSLYQNSCGILDKNLYSGPTFGCSAIDLAIR